MFEKVLRAFAEGDIHYADVQLDLKRLLTGGASPEKLLEVLERWELIDPLPDYAREGIVRHINEAIELAAAQNANLDAAPDQNQAAEAGSPPAAPPAPGTMDRDAGSATARTGALAADLTAARAALELEQGKNRELRNALAERMAADEDALSRSEQLARESERYQAELRTLRASLAARDKSVEQLRHSLGERDAQLSALQLEHTKIVPLLDSRMKAGVQQETELQAARARIDALVADLAAARAAVESERNKAQEIDRVLAEKASLSEAAQSQSEDAHQESERYRIELRTVRDSLAARDKSIAQVRHSLAERDAQLTALQKEHAKIAAALEARAKAAETELKAARARIDTVTADLKASHAAAAALSAQRERGDSHLTAVRTELGAVQARSSSYLEVLQTHEWRRELDASSDVAAAGIETQRAADLPVTAPVRPLAPSAKIEPLAARQSAPRAALQPERAARSAKSPPAKRGEFWKRGVIAPAAGLGVAILVLVFVFWFFAHRSPAPTPVTVPAVASVVTPEPGTDLRDCPTCPGMTVLPAGRFKQGSAGTDSGSSFDKPQHWVVIGRPFAMATNAVTLDEFREFITATGHDMQGCDVYDGEWKHQPQSSWENPGFVQSGSHPVTCASWADAQAYAAWLSTKTGHRYRLPSASEWEYAARAGGEAEHPWNPDGSGACASANVADQSAARRYPGWTVFGCDDGYIFTAPVGSFKASAFGLNDMLGNVFQWTEDCWHEDYKGAPIDGSARTDGDCSEHELRGGSWFTTPAFVRASYRNHFATNYRTSSVGIRLVRDLAP